jgi:hypothetical protein
MSLDLSKLTDAVTKVASLAQSHAVVVASHADTSGALAAAVADADALRKEIADAQGGIDHLTETLLAACTSPAEAVGLTAVAAALVAPVAPVAPVAAPISVDPLSVIFPTITPVATVAPVILPAPVAAPVVTATLLPSVDLMPAPASPVAPAAPMTLEELNAHIARQNASAPSATG